MRWGSRVVLAASEDSVGYGLRVLGTAMLVWHRKHGRSLHYRPSDGLSEPLRSDYVNQLLGPAVTASSVWAVRAGRLPEPGWALHWLALEDAAQRLAVRPAFALAWVLDAVHRKAVEPVPGSIAAAGRRLAQALADFDVHVIAGAVSRTASGVRSLAERARRPQARQLHQYYLQAVIVAVVAMALLVTPRLPR